MREITEMFGEIPGGGIEGETFEEVLSEKYMKNET